MDPVFMQKSIFATFMKEIELIKKLSNKSVHTDYRYK